MLYKDDNGTYFTVMKTPGKRPRYGVAHRSPVTGGWHFLNWRHKYETYEEAELDLAKLAVEFHLTLYVKGRHEVRSL